jgi:hypothetical protein
MGMPIQSDPWTLTLTGMLPFILLTSAALTFPISFGLIRLYRRAVIASMRSSAAPEAVPPPIERSAPPLLPGNSLPGPKIAYAACGSASAKAADVLGWAAWRAPWRGAANYVLGRLAYAAIMASAFFLRRLVGWPLIGSARVMKRNGSTTTH